ncbi:hypothetical protein LIER_15100 [Lithospermum erythrorhizon]|uniref:Reverse transcriptase zinc-binding domain-containing protein n=1 Tax=Lithospermum erythrorhizon TaxID=34254 RepID=A0AAV3Q402_LITER
MQMPEAVYNKIEKIFNTFLFDGMTWCKWSKVCAPYEEGGLNMRRLADLHQAFMQKAWKRLREGNSLCSRFMLNKYCGKHHPRIVPVHPSHSRVWKNLHKVRDEAESNIHWQLGQGLCDFWMDSWMELGPLCNHYPDQKGGIRVNEVWLNGTWDEAALSNLISPDHLHRVKEVFIDQGKPDLLLWKSSKDGQFSFKSTYEAVREQRHPSSLYSVIWHQNIPKKMSFVAWRLLNGWLPVDEVMSKKGIVLASKCMCCAQMKTLNHVFFTNPIAQQLWSHFASLVGIKSNNIQSIQQLLRIWSLSVNTVGHIKQVIPIVILWAIWKARNKAKHMAIPFSFRRLRSRIISVKHKGPTLLCWEKPEKGALKLNIDAAFKDGRGGYGGILRNDQGELVVAMRLEEKCETPLDAEIQALLICLQECIARGYERMGIVITFQRYFIKHWEYST